MDPMQSVVAGDGTRARPAMPHRTATIPVEACVMLQRRLLADGRAVSGSKGGDQAIGRYPTRVAMMIADAGNLWLHAKS